MTEELDPAVISANLKRPEGEVGAGLAQEMAKSNLFMAQRSLAALAPSPGETIVEIGPASGTLSIPVAKVLGKDGRFIGLDHSAEMAMRARDHLAEQTACHLEFIVGDCVDADIPAGSVDGVFANNVLYFIDDPGSLFEVCARWLRPGGRAVFGIATETTLAGHPLAGAEFNVRSTDTYLRALAKAGFEAIGLTYFGPTLREVRGQPFEADFVIIAGRRRAA